MNKSILITGGTGSLGQALVKHILETRNEEFSKIIVFSRDEQKQYQMSLENLLMLMMD